MRYYRCKCGYRESIGSMAPEPCESCPKCGSNLATGPDFHKDPLPHNWVIRYDEYTGARYEVCNRCGVRKDILAVEQVIKKEF